MPSKRLQAVKPTQPERGQGVASPPTIRPLVRGPQQETGTPGSLVGKDSHHPSVPALTFAMVADPTLKFQKLAWDNCF